MMNIIITLITTTITKDHREIEQFALEFNYLTLHFINHIVCFVLLLYLLHPILQFTMKILIHLLLMMIFKIDYCSTYSYRNSPLFVRACVCVCCASVNHILLSAQFHTFSIGYCHHFSFWVMTMSSQCHCDDDDNTWQEKNHKTQKTNVAMHTQTATQHAVVLDTHICSPLSMSLALIVCHDQQQQYSDDFQIIES